MAENTPLIYKKIIEVMADINAIGKDRRNKDFNFQFRGIDDVMNELHGSLAKFGVFVVPNVLAESRSEGKTKNGGTMFYTRLKINFGFYAEDGSHVDAVVIGEAMDTSDKASNKALSIGLKYAMLQVFCIPTEDDKDPDAVSPQPAAGTMRGEQLPPPVNATKAAFSGKVLKGGETTAEEKAELKKLMASTYPDGSRVFTKDEAINYSNMRDTKTAAEVIEQVKKDLSARMPQQTAGDILRKQEEEPKQPTFEEMPPVETEEKDEHGFSIF